MKRLRILITILAAAAAVLLPACAGRGPAPMIETRGAGGFRFVQTFASIRDDSTVVSGRLSGDHFGLTRGHVDAALYGPDGELAAVASSRPVLKKRGRGTHVNYAFRVRLDVAAPPGSTVRLVLHEPKGNRVHCDENRAVRAK